MSKNTNIWNNYTSHLTGTTGTDITLLRRIARGRVLDVGCGIGGHLACLNSASIELRVGVDPGFSGLIKGRRLFPDINFVNSSGYALPFQDQTFDLVICIDVIEHVASPDELLKEIYRVLRTRGTLFLQTPNYPAKRFFDIWHWLRRTRRTASDDSTHVTKLNASRLIGLVRRAGFAVQLTKARNLPFEKYFPWIQKFKTYSAMFPFTQKIIVIGQKT